MKDVNVERVKVEVGRALRVTRAFRDILRRQQGLPYCRTPFP
jgi:hypothetical protein